MITPHITLTAVFVPHGHQIEITMVSHEADPLAVTYIRCDDYAGDHEINELTLLLRKHLDHAIKGFMADVPKLREVSLKES